ncbi:TetR/AcrR family transcriptional regulator [Rhodococcus zopfii]
MPRIASARDAAEPGSAEPRAARPHPEGGGVLGAENDPERVRMHEVAKLAGVAIGTLYRCFPSEAHLFVAVMVDRIERTALSLAHRSWWRCGSGSSDQPSTGAPRFPVPCPDQRGPAR